MTDNPNEFTIGRYADGEPVTVDADLQPSGRPARLERQPAGKSLILTADERRRIRYLALRQAEDDLVAEWNDQADADPGMAAYTAACVRSQYAVASLTGPAARLRDLLIASTDAAHRLFGYDVPGYIVMPLDVPDPVTDQHLLDAQRRVDYLAMRRRCYTVAATVYDATIAGCGDQYNARVSAERALYGGWPVALGDGFTEVFRASRAMTRDQADRVQEIYERYRDAKRDRVERASLQVRRELEAAGLYRVNDWDHTRAWAFVDELRDSVGDGVCDVALAVLASDNYLISGPDFHILTAWWVDAGFTLPQAVGHNGFARRITLRGGVVRRLTNAVARARKS